MFDVEFITCFISLYQNLLLTWVHTKWKDLLLLHSCLNRGLHFFIDSQVQINLYHLLPSNSGRMTHLSEWPKLRGGHHLRLGPIVIPNRLANKSFLVSILFIYILFISLGEEIVYTGNSPTLSREDDNQTMTNMNVHFQIVMNNTRSSSSWQILISNFQNVMNTNRSPSLIGFYTADALICWLLVW